MAVPWWPWVWASASLSYVGKRNAARVHVLCFVRTKGWEGTKLTRLDLVCVTHRVQNAGVPVPPALLSRVATAQTAAASNGAAAVGTRSGGLIGLAMLVGGGVTITSLAAPQLCASTDHAFVMKALRCVHGVLDATAAAGHGASGVALLSVRSSAVLAHGLLACMAVEPVVAPAGPPQAGSSTSHTLSDRCPTQSLLHR